MRKQKSFFQLVQRLFLLGFLVWGRYKHDTDFILLVGFILVSSAVFQLVDKEVSNDK